MAEKPKGPAPRDKGKEKGKEKEAPKKAKSSGILFKLILVFVLLLMLAGGGVAAGIYLGLIDLPAIAAKYKLHDLPVVGQYIPKPATNFETVDLPPEAPAAEKPAAEAPPAPAPPAAKPEELKENLAKTRQEEAKRISRLARLYGEMKPDEALPILRELDDPTVLAILAKMEDGQAAKIMALFDAKRAARLTQDMLKGKTM